MIPPFTCAAAGHSSSTAPRMLACTASCLCPSRMPLALPVNQAGRCTPPPHLAQQGIPLLHMRTKLTLEVVEVVPIPLLQCIQLSAACLQFCQALLCSSQFCLKGICTGTLCSFCLLCLPQLVCKLLRHGFTCCVLCILCMPQLLYRLQQQRWEHGVLCLGALCSSYLLCPSTRSHGQRLHLRRSRCQPVPQYGLS